MRRCLLPVLALALLLSGCGLRPVTAAPVPAGSAPPALPTETPAAPTPMPSPTPCGHAWEEGVCTLCGQVCPHEGWEDGRCLRCGKACAHPGHDGETRLCGVCGAAVPHEFIDGRCTLCGQAPEFYDALLPRELFDTCPRRGEVREVSYTTTAYTPTTAQEPITYQRKMLVYLPWGYDPAERYDLVVLLHGRGGSERYWLGGPECYSPESKEKDVYTRDLLDNLIASGRSRRVIVAAPTYYRDSADPDAYDRRMEEPRFIRELREDILPTLIESFSTFAQGTAPEDIIAAREHFGFAGLSMGSIYIYTGVLPDCLDYFGWFGCFSGSDGYMDNLSYVLNRSQYTISYFYNSVGERDSYWGLHNGQYGDLVKWTNGLVPDKNTAITTIAGVGHEYAAWSAGLANFLSVAFAAP